MKTVVCHSGGMDSSICLAIAMRDCGAENVYSLGFDFGQRHVFELQCGARICEQWGIPRKVINLPMYREITTNALLDEAMEIEHLAGKPANTMVVARNGTFSWLSRLLCGSCQSLHPSTLGLGSLRHRIGLSRLFLESIWT